MIKPSDQKKTITSKLSSEQPEAVELTGQDLDEVSGGLEVPINLGKVSGSIGWKQSDEPPKETVTFVYGALQVPYKP